jgi:hypothetical protein
MKNMMTLAASLLLASCSLAAGREGQPEFRCHVTVLHSEELPIGPAFHHTFRVTLLVTAPDSRTFETTVQKVVPWQTPPPRPGQRALIKCDARSALALWMPFKPKKFDISVYPRWIIPPRLAPCQHFWSSPTADTWMDRVGKPPARLRAHGMSLLRPEMRDIRLHLIIALIAYTAPPPQTAADAGETESGMPKGSRHDRRRTRRGASASA